MRGIEIHYEQPDGARGVINYFTGDNAEVYAASSKEREGRRQRLLNKARTMAGAWAAVFPADKIFVAEIA